MTQQPEPGATNPLRATESDALLLREARHRIGNSLQVVAGVLLHSAQKSETDSARAHLNAAYSRVMAVAALERQLASGSGDDVELPGYLGRLCDTVTASVIEDPERIVLKAFVDPVVLPADAAASLGMIATELVMNALKHAFPDGRRGAIDVTYDRQGEGWVLAVRDTGVGRPAEPARRGLGTEIVEALARQLGAAVETTEAFPGTTVSIRYRP
jgi:two-component sensor histidine kinase